MTAVYILREPDDPLAETRISLGSPRGSDDFYMVFRGDPEKVIKLLKQATVVAEEALPQGNYQDKRRPQG
jgi:hypothetical protein